jgi:hypothetical protein
LFVADGIVFPVYRAWQAMPIRIDEAREAFIRFSRIRSNGSTRNVRRFSHEVHFVYFILLFGGFSAQ